MASLGLAQVEAEYIGMMTAIARVENDKQPTSLHTKLQLQLIALVIGTSSRPCRRTVEAGILDIGTSSGDFVSLRQYIGSCHNSHDADMTSIVFITQIIGEENRGPSRRFSHAPNLWNGC